MQVKHDIGSKWEAMTAEQKMSYIDMVVNTKAANKEAKRKFPQNVAEKSRKRRNVIHNLALVVI